MNVITASNKSKQTGGRARLPSHLPFIYVLIYQLTQMAGDVIMFLYAVRNEHPLRGDRALISHIRIIKIRCETDLTVLPALTVGDKCQLRSESSVVVYGIVSI